jgi:FMN phosphatase YigB (HAD superfamily)
MITTLFFDLHGVLVDPAIIHERQPGVQAALLAGRYGGDASEWRAAYEAVRADWRSYWADLDTDGEHGIEDLWEGELRVLRAHFRLTGTPYPPAAELRDLARERQYLVMREIDAAYPEVRAVVAGLREVGYTMGIASNAVLARCRGSLEGAGLQSYITGPIAAADVVRSMGKEADTYRLAFRQGGAPPEACVVVDDNADGIMGAKEAGAHTVLIERPDRNDRRPLDTARRAADAILPDLRTLPAYISALHTT